MRSLFGQWQSVIAVLPDHLHCIWQQLSSVRCTRVVRFAPATILDLADCEKLLSQLPGSIQSDNIQRRESVVPPLVEHHDIQLHRTLAFDKFDLASRPHSPKTRHQVPLVGSRTTVRLIEFFANFWTKYQCIIHRCPLIDALISSQVSTLSGFIS